MMTKIFIQRYIILPMAITFLFAVYCTASVATNDNLGDTLETKINRSIDTPLDAMAFVPAKKPV